MSAHRPCRDAMCDVCRGDTHVVGPNPDTAPVLPQGWSVRTQRTERKHWDGHSIVRWGYLVHRPGWWAQVSEYRWSTEAAAMKAGLADAAGVAELVEEK